MIDRLIDALRRANTAIALLVGMVLLATVAFILLDIALRQMGRSLGGSDEISGYVMAGVASWGLSFALIELAHVRIDLLRLRMPAPGRAALDLLAVIALTATVTVIAFQSWPVLEKTVMRGSRANTPLETPLWIPQLVWFSGWVWFALAAMALVLCAVALLVRRDMAGADGVIGTLSEVGAEP